MNRCWRVSACLALAVFATAGSRAQGSEQKGGEHKSDAARALKGRLEERGGRRVLTLWGSPRERGYAHGYLLARDINYLLAKDFAGFLETRRMAAADYESKVVGFIVKAFEWSESERAELDGMLAGIRARLAPRERRIDFLDRELSLADLKAINTAGDWLNLGCSTLVMRGKFSADGKPLVVRNFDFFGFRSLLDKQLVIRSLPHGKGAARAHAWLGVTHPGLIGVITTMNDERVFASIHDVPIRAPKLFFLRRHVPRLLAMRRLAERLDAAKAVETAKELLLKWPTLYGNNFLVATPSAAGRFAGVLEYDSDRALGNGVTLRAGDRTGADDAVDWLACTNHHRARRIRAGAKLDWCNCYRKLGAWIKAREAAAQPEDAQALTPVELFELASRISMSAKDQIQKHIELGTLHQAVARIGAGELHLKLGRIGAAVAAQKPLVFTIRELQDLAKKLLRAGG